MLSSVRWVSRSDGEEGVHDLLAMGFLKFANAALQKPGIQFSEWDALRRKAILPEPEFQKRTARVILQEYDPSQYMLSHATIVASVDVDSATAPTGRHFIEGFEVNRPFQDYYVTPGTQRFINNNNDCFERKLLMASFKTFIGAQSYIEHVQIPELSQGRIIDAAARDIGDSVYVDILIANDLKHAALIRSIKSGQLGTLSMGCFIPGTQVSMADGTRVSIEDVKVGDQVLSHRGRACEVVNQQIHIGQFAMRKIGVASVVNSITATRNHPFFVLREKERYVADTVIDAIVDLECRLAFDPPLVEVKAEDLQVGDLVCLPRDHGAHIFFPVRSIETVLYDGPVFDMEVEGDHSYVVEGVAVHNCSTTSTTCTKCGNVAKDETQLCACVRYFKGQAFVDEGKVTRKVAELCGHFTDPSSVRFIEASWVANPAFKGAVLRSVLSAEDVAHVENKLHMAFSKNAPAPIPGGVAKAARALFAQDEGQQAPAQQETPAQQAPADAPAESGEAPGGAPATPPAGGDDDPIDKAVKDLSTALRDKAIEQVRQEITKGEVRDIVDSNKQNESLIRSALEHPQWRRLARFVVSFVGKPQAKRVFQGLILHKNGGWRRVKQAGLTGREILAVSRVLDVLTRKSSMAGETRVYRTVLSVGGTAPYEDDETYLAACRQVLGRVVTGSEASKLLEKGRLYALGRS